MRRGKKIELERWLKDHIAAGSGEDIRLDEDARSGEDVRFGENIRLDEAVRSGTAVRVGEAEVGQLMHALAPVSEGYLRKLLRESGAPLDPMIEGVRQATLDDLERSLITFSDLYQQADVFRKMAIRKLVITAKDHARLSVRAARVSPEKLEQKTETVLWLTTWLENPPLFPAWVRIRRGTHPHS